MLQSLKLCDGDLGVHYASVSVLCTFNFFLIKKKEKRKGKSDSDH